MRGKFDPSSLDDLTGKVAIVTGANVGIGYETARNLARCGAKVYLGARNKSKAMAAIQKIEAKGLGPRKGSVHFLDIDLSDTRKVESTAAWFLSQEERLDILSALFQADTFAIILTDHAAVNNAGILCEGGPVIKTADGLMEVMVVNHISPFLLTALLLPIMKTTARLEGSDVRIINVSSRGHVRFPISSISKKSFITHSADNYEARKMPNSPIYSFSKLTNILHMKELQRRLNEEGVPIICMSVHPGDVRTASLNRTLSSLHMSPVLKLIVYPTSISQKAGAYTSVFAAASPQVKKNPEMYKGCYLVPFGKIATPSKDARNPDLAEQLWRATLSTLHDLQIELPE